ncbi:MAG: hypothetical protein HFJ59_01535 [Clostridia bacterium]|nr:hypothetical protein [Clostridia bacterium]
MKKIIRKSFITIMIALILIIMMVVKSEAGLQANPNTHYKKQLLIDDWMVEIRNMEKIGESMGLSEELNEDLTSKNGSNNIDVHLMRSTEYGAIAILSASGYGNPQTLQESTIKTTTGNKTGIYFSENNAEIVAGGRETSKPVGANSRYYDIYTADNSSAKRGDALGNSTTINPGCAGWHGASKQGWIVNYHFWRGYGGLFSFSWSGASYETDAFKNYARGVAVCGEGL